MTGLYPAEAWSKNLHGQKNLYYQVNATYYSALGESDEKMLLARAIQMFMSGKPQIWYLDLFAGKNDHEAVQRAGNPDIRKSTGQIFPLIRSRKD